MHRPVMTEEVVRYLNVKPGAKIIDATLNGGGHSMAILERYPDVQVLGIEWDPEIVNNFRFQISDFRFKDRLSIINDSYVNLREIVAEHNFLPDGILFDLGVSSWHYENSGKGFSFQKDELLDMRFNPNEERKNAANVVNTYSFKDLEKVLREYGEEKHSENIAKNIIKARNIKPVIRTNELVEIIENSVPGWYKHRKISSATKTFQALRIEVNNELDNVEKGVLAAIDVLNIGGRLVVISFHGLEDKIVREIFKQKTKDGVVEWVKKGTIKAKWEEVKENPRSRSAKMKIIQKN